MGWERQMARFLYTLIRPLRPATGNHTFAHPGS
jgi:hypothetical protein